MKKKKLLLFAVLLIAWLFVPLPLGANTYVEDNFDGLADGTAVPDGWDNTKGTTSTVGHRWSRFSPGFGGEGLCLRFNSYTNSNGNTNILLTPSFTIPANSPATLKFKFKNPTGGKLSVNVTTDDGTTLTLLEDNLSASDWTDKEYSLKQYAGQLIRVAFSSVSNYGNGDAYHYLDNVLIQDPSQCARPINLGLYGVSQNSATISWSLDYAIADPYQYQIRVHKESDGTSVLTNNALVPDGQMYTITGLAAGTEYFMTLKSDCQDTYHGVSDLSQIFHFSTLLDPVTLPYVQTFDADEDMPIGIITDGQVEVSDTRYGATGRSVKLTSTATDLALIVFPQMDHFTNDLQFAAWVRATAVNAEYTVGLMSDPSDGSTFVPVYNGVVPTTSSWFNVRFNTANLAMAEKNYSLAIMVPDGFAKSIFFDEVRITSIPSCPRPELLTVSAIDSANATLAWEGKVSPLVRQVQLVAGTDTTYQTLTTNPGQIRNLTFNTSYTSVRVREICSNAVGDTSEWSLPASFKTLCGINQTTTFNEEFNAGIPECWKQRQTVAPTGTSGSDFGDNAWDSYMQLGRQTLRLKDACAGAHTLLIVQPIYIDQAGKYDVVLGRYRSSGTKAQEGIALYINNTPDLEGTPQVCGFIPSGYTFAPIESNEGWYQYVYNIQKTGVVYIILEGITQYGNASYIDYVRVEEAPTCRPIARGGFNFTDVTTTTAKLSWPTSDNVQGTILRYIFTCPEHTIADTITVPYTAGATQSYTFNGLTPGTRYNLSCSLANYCGGTDTSTYIEYTTQFVTNCLSRTLPMTEGFDASSQLPVCWEQISDGAKNYWSVYEGTSYSAKGGKSIQMPYHFSSTNPLLVSPQYDFPDGDYRISFYMYRRSLSGPVEGVKIWINDTKDTVGGNLIKYMVADLDAAPSETALGMYKYHFDFHASGLNYLVLEGITDHRYTIFLDEITIEEAPSCSEMGRFTLQAQGDTSILVTLADAEITDWEAIYGPKGFSITNGEGTIVSSSTNSLTITGLTGLTEYEVYIRRVCGTEHSAWSDFSQSATTFATPFVILGTSEYFEDFESFRDGENIKRYFVTVNSSGNAGVAPIAEDSEHNTKAFAGTLYAKQRYGYDQIHYIPVRLTANVNYSASGYFAQDGNLATTTSAAIVLMSAPVFNGATELASMVVLKEWTYLEAYFTVPTDGVYYVGYHLKQNSTPWLVGMDNLRIRELSCIPPTNSTVSQITTNSARIDWGSTATEWEIKVTGERLSDYNSNVTMVFNDTVTDKFVNVPGLTANAEYFYAIRTLCGETPSDWSQPKSFRTECDAVTTPYSLDFEDVDMADLLCWNVQGEGASVDRSTTAYAGSGSLSVRSAMLVSPQFVVTSLADYMTTGWVRSTIDSASFAIGVMTDPSDIGTFEPMGSILIPKKNIWQEFTSYFTLLNDPDYVDFVGAKYIAITASTPEATYYFDDILVDEIPTCPKPTEPMLTNITAEQFTLGWLPSGSETQWQVLLKNNFGTILLDTVVNTNPCTIEGLRGNTIYNVYLASICQSGDTSSFANCGSFTTPCSTEHLPFHMVLTSDNSGIPACWEKGASNSSSTFDWRTVTADGSLCLRFNDYGSYTLYCSSIITPVIDLGNAPAIVLGTDVKCYSAQSLSVIVHDQTTLEIDTIGVIAATSANESAYYEFDMSSHSGHMVKVELRGIGGASSSSNILIYTLTVEETLPCSKPNGVAKVSAATTTIDFLLTDNNVEHTAWQYVIGALDFDINTATPVDITSKQFQVKGLSASTYYQIYVRAVCGENEYSLWSTPITASTDCEAQSIPYYEGFEVYTSQSLYDACFKLISNKVNGNNTPRAEIETSTYKYEGAQGMKLYSSIDDPFFIVLPEMEDDLYTLKLQFYYRNESLVSSNSHLTVGVMSDPADRSTFVAITELPFVNTFTKVSVAFDTVAAVAGEFNGRIAFKYGPTVSRYNCGLDAIRISSLTACTPVEQIILNEVTSGSVTVVAQSERRAAQYEVAYGVGATTADECTSSIIVNSDTITINGLLEGHSYNLFARSICGENDTTAWFGPMMVQSGCDVHVLNQGDQYVEDFDIDGQAGSFPGCIYRLETSTVSGTNYPILTTTNKVTGTHSMYLKGINSVVLPKFSAATKNLKVSFSVRGTGTLYLGTANDYDRSSFRSVSTFSLSSGNQFARKEVDLSTYDTEMGDMIVFYTLVGTTEVYIDSLVVEWAPTCYAPRNIKVVASADTTATIAWRTAPDATMNEYEVINVTASDTIVGTIVGDTLRLIGLAPVSNYKVNVRTHCGTIDTTDWSSVTFTTTEILATAPYVTSFEDEEDNASWKYVTATNHSDKFIIGSDPAAVNTGTKSLYVSNNNASYAYSGPDGWYNDLYDETVYEHETFFAYRTIYLEQGLYNISFDWKGIGRDGGAYYYDIFGRVFLMPNNGSLSADYTGYATNAQNIMLSDQLWKGSTWATATRNFTIVNAGIYRIVVAWDQEEDPGTNSTPLAIDNLSITPLSCSDVVNMTAKNVLESSATITFVNPNDDKSTEWYYTSGTFVSDTLVVTNDTINLTGLTESTSYTVYARSACADEYNQWIQVSFTTPCRAIVVDGANPYFEGFESYTESDKLLFQVDNCWSEYSLGTSGSTAKFRIQTSPQSYDREPYEGNNYLSIQYLTDNGIVRDFMLEGGRSYDISFMAKLDETNPWCLAEVISIDGDYYETLSTASLDNEWKSYSASFTPPTDGVYTLGIRIYLTSSPWYACVDNFAIEYSAYGAPQGLTVSEITATEADIDWTGVSDSYQIQIKNGGLVIIDSVGDFTSFHATGLSPSTTYTVSVRTNQDGEYSKWSNTTFTTDCDVVNVPFVQDFSAITGTIPNCWDNTTGSTGTTSNTWKVAYQDADSVLYISVSLAKGKNMIKTPGIDLGTTTNLLSFDYCNTSAYDTLIAVISTDHGQTFTDTLLQAPRTTARKTFTYNLEDYVGDTIILAFISNASYQNTGLYMYVDNVRINCKGEDVVHNNISLCPGEPYFGYGFNVPASATNQSGILEFTKLHIGETLGECDYTEKLILDVKQGGIQIIDASICIGEMYVSDLFPTGISSPGSYTTYAQSEDGCDITVYLNLTVSNPYYEYEHIICDNDTYTFGGKVLNKSGIYTDTIQVPGSTCDSIVKLTLNVLQSRFDEKMTVCEGDRLNWQDTILTTTGKYQRKYTNSLGCDSIYTMDFTVLGKYFEVDSTICSGQSVKFGVETYFDSGDYTFTFENQLSCDSIVTLHLTVTPPDTLDFDDYVCEGYEYSNDGINYITITKDTVLEQQKQSIGGCITINRTYVDFLETKYYEYTINLAEGETYNFCGNTISKAGDYTCTYQTTEHGCDSVVTLHLNVGTGIDMVESQQLIVAPNPIKRGEVSYVNRDWSAAERQNMIVETLNSLGQVIQRFNPSSFPIEIGNLQVSGTYYVRIITGTGERYVGRLIIK